MCLHSGPQAPGAKHACKTLYKIYAAREEEIPGPEPEEGFMTSSKFYCLLRDCGVIPGTYDHKAVHKLFNFALGVDYLKQKELPMEAPLDRAKILLS